MELKLDVERILSDRFQNLKYQRKAFYFLERPTYFYAVIKPRIAQIIFHRFWK